MVPTCLACDRKVPKRGRRRCPLCRDHRAARPADCPSCRKSIPRSRKWPRQCPECAQVFAGRGWAGIESHWRASHLPFASVFSAAAFFASLRPQMDTDAPAAAMPWAIPRPMPPLPPVTMTTRPVRSKSDTNSSCCCYLQSS